MKDIYPGLSGMNESLFESIQTINQRADLDGYQKGILIRNLVLDGKGQPQKTVPNNIRVERIRFEDYRLFRDVEVNFAFPLTVLVGVNGKGKTSVLRALANHLSWLVAKILKEKGVGSRMTALDISNNSQTHAARVSVTFEVGDTKIGDKLSATLATQSSFERTAITSNLEDYALYGDILRQVRGLSKYQNLPLFAYYGVERTCLLRGKASAKKSVQPEDAFRTALMGTKAAQLVSFADWYVKLSKLAVNAENAEERQRAQQSLDIVSQALVDVIPSFDGMRLDQSSGGDEIRVGLDGSEVLFEQLSDGQRLFVSLIADIAWRLLVLNPQGSEPLHGHGIVLIDEVELHLHPTWQQIVLPGLLRAFPGLQFIVTTHSPQVLTTADGSAIRLLTADVGEEKKVIYRKPLVQTKGRESGDVLADVLGTHPRPNIEEKEWLSRCYDLIESKRTDVESEIEELLGKIRDHFGKSSFEYLSLNNFKLASRKRVQ